ncbi:MAG TPA: kelch repeat-containing protein, partial [Tepidisphaeraceae bacterium]|nr:kelch repeat-containing protein [Tepidisphaeraceae bacterium]
MNSLLTRFAPCISLIAATVLGAQDLPPRRAHHALEYDPVRKIVLMTGGSTPIDGGRNFLFFNDVWAYDGRTWMSLPSSGNKLSGMRLAFDKKRGRMISWGGYDGADASGELRNLDANTWTTLGSYRDQRVAEAGFVYDSRRDRFVWFGGGGGGGPTRGETWIYRGDKWSRLDIPGPSAREAHAMVYDEKRDRVVVFGGMHSDGPGRPPTMLGDTWEFDGDKWTRIDAPGPSASASAGATYDSKRGRVILFGGAAQGGFTNAT